MFVITRNYYTCSILILYLKFIIDLLFHLHSTMARDAKTVALPRINIDAVP